MTHPPAYLRRAIEQRTGLPLSLTNGYAKPGTCPTCGRVILAGYDNTPTGYLAIADPFTATPTEEAAAWLHLGRSTWQLHGTPGRYELWPRTFPGQTHLDITTTAADVTVVIEHRCGQPLATGPPIQVKPIRTVDLPDHPPY